MFNMLNKSPYLQADAEIGSSEVDSYNSDLLVADDTPIEAETTEETEAPAEVETSEVETPTPKIKYKYNHEDMEMDSEEAPEWIQKGKNYDHVKDKLTALEADPRLPQHARMKQLADSYGMTEDEYLGALQQQYFDSTAEKQGLTPAQVQRDYELNAREQAQTQRDNTSATQRQQDKMYSNFTSNFPDAEPESITPDTWAKVEAGMDLTTAYVQQQNTELQAQVKALKQNETNAGRSPVKGATTHGSKEIATKDPFLMGFDSI